MRRIEPHLVASLRRPRQHHRAMNRMFQLAHVARPRPAAQTCPRGIAQHHLRQPHPQSALFAEISRQQHHVIVAIAQRRHRERKHAQAVIEIGAKTAGNHLLAQIAVGGRQYPYINPQAAIVAHALDIAILQYAQQFSL